MDSIFPGSVYENPEQPEESVRPAEGAPAARRGRMEGPRRAGRLVEERTAAHIEIVYGDQASERYFTIYQEDLRKVGITLNLRLVDVRDARQAARRADLRHGVDRLHGRALPEPGTSPGVSTWPTRRTPTTSPASRTRAPTRSLHTYNEDVRLQEARQAPPGARRHRHQRAPLDPRVDGAVQRVVYWNKFGQPEGI